MLDRKYPPWLDGYPVMSYNPEKRHCGFFFDPLFYGANVSNVEFTEISAEHAEMERTKALFPRKEDIEILFTQEQHTLAEKFTGVKGKVICRDSGEGYDRRLVINHQSVPFATALGFEMKFPFITYNLHNCATPNLAVRIYPLGLQALKRIYDSYGLDSTPLPSMHFTKEGFNFRFPFPILTESQKRDNPSNLEEILKKTRLPFEKPPFEITGQTAPYSIRIGGCELRVETKEGTRIMTGQVSNRIEEDLRNIIAINLLCLASTQASILYRDQHYCENDP